MTDGSWLTSPAQQGAGRGDGARLPVLQVAYAICGVGISGAAELRQTVRSLVRIKGALHAELDAAIGEVIVRHGARYLAQLLLIRHRVSPLLFGVVGFRFRLLFCRGFGALAAADPFCASSASSA